MNKYKKCDTINRAGDNMNYNEGSVFRSNLNILNIILFDRSASRDLVFATSMYKIHGELYKEDGYITPKLISGKMKNLIKPKINKKPSDIDRVKLIFDSWRFNVDNDKHNFKFDCNNVFGDELGSCLNVEDWKNSISKKILIMECEEATCLVTRYNLETKEVIEPFKRRGILDKRLNLINQNINDEKEWYDMVLVAYKSIYGFDYRGDNVLLARENLLHDFVDNYRYKFYKDPSEEQLIEVAKIVSWNIWQMDALKFVIPFSCINIRKEDFQLSIFEDENEALTGNWCMGCRFDDFKKHNGTYCKIKDWDSGKIIKFVDLVKKI